MRRCLALLLTLPLLLPACLGPSPGAAKGPAFAVETWDGQKLSGPIRLADGQLAVGRRRLPIADVGIISQETESAAGRAARVEGFEPLRDAALARYRERADAIARKYPGSTAIVCLDQGQESLLPDAQQVFRYHALILILKEEGRRAADLALGFEEGRSRARFLFARSVAPDGRSQWLDLASLEVAVPSQDAEFLDTRMRILSGRVPGAEVGSLVEFVYERTLYNPEVPDYFFPGFRFRDEQPTLDSIFDVRVPAGRRLNWTTRHMPESAREPKRSSRGGFDVCRWELHDVPPYTIEPLMPDPYDIVPLVQCSLFFDWRALLERTGSFQRERIQVTPQIRDLAQRLTRGATTDDQRLAALYAWVQRNIRYLSIKGSLSSGWAGHAASETLRNGYGDCTDKAILFASLCQALGIRAYPALVRTNDSGTAITDIPVPDANHCISLVFPNGQPRFLDTTASDYRYPYFRSDDHGAQAILCMTSQTLTIPVPPPEDNQRDSTVQLDLRPDGSAAVAESNAYTGTYESSVRYYWRTKPPELRQRLMQQVLQQQTPGAQVTSFTPSDLDDLSKPLTTDIRYTIPAFATRVRDLYIVSLPGFARDFASASLPTREFPIVRTTTQGARTTYRVACPPGCQLVGVPDPLTIQGKHIVYEGRVTAAPDGRSLTVTEVFKLPTRVLPTADYAEYRAQAARIAAWTRLKLVFRKTVP